MYLSKLDLNTKLRGVYRLLSDVYSQHRFVMSAFPDMDRSQKVGQGAQRVANVLYRTEMTSDKRNFSLLVQSADEPDWNKTIALHPDVICICKQKEDNRVFEIGDRLRFRLRANPTVCRVNRDQAGNPNPKREGLYKEAEQLDWLVRVANLSGFNVNPETVLVTDLGKQDGYKPSSETALEKNNIKCFMADFNGTLTVTDSKALHEAIQKGVGRGKAWGCGLLSLAKA